MAESGQFTITDAAYDTAQRLCDDGWFTDKSDAGVFAAAFVIRKHFDDVDPGTLRYSGTHNNQYASVDKDGTWESLIRKLYNTDTPRLYFRNLIIWGLEFIGKHIQEEGLFQITDFI